MTPTPAAMPRRRTRRRQLDDGGPLVAGHQQCLRDIDAGHIRHVPRDDGHHHWTWVDWPTVRISRPRRWYLDELARAGWIAVDGGVVVRTAGEGVAA